MTEPDLQGHCVRGDQMLPVPLPGRGIHTWRERGSCGAIYARPPTALVHTPELTQIRLQ